MIVIFNEYNAGNRPKKTPMIPSKMKTIAAYQHFMMVIFNQYIPVNKPKKNKLLHLKWKQ